MFRKKNRRKFIYLLSIILLVFSLIAPAMVTAEPTDKIQKSVKNSKTNDIEKISNRLLEQFEEDEKVTFLIKFEEKADTKQAAAQANEKAEKENATAYERELMQRSAVVSELKTVADLSQKEVRHFLKTEEEEGRAESIQPYYIVNGMAVTATKNVAEKVASFSEVEKILPNEKRQLISNASIENSSKTESTDEVEWNVERIDALEVWDMGIDGTGTVVASIDSGVQWDHPALKENYRGYDPETGEVNHDFNWYDPVFYDDVPYDDVGHGTHVTGIMVGNEPDGTNQIGVAPGAQWISVKAFSHAGGFDDDLLAAAQWIIAPTDYEGNKRVDMAPDVVNNSWGGGPGLDEWYRDVVIAWRHANIFPEFSAGNTDLYNPGGPGSIATPANYPESFATGATDFNDNLADFSLRGPSPYDEIKPDISAPGVDIRSAYPGDAYGLSSGTSMAGPAVSGVAAMMRQVNASLTVDEMEAILTDTAIPKTDEEYPESPNNGYGYGLVNAHEAVTAVVSGFDTITGVITEEGDDHEAPEFVHSPLTTVQPNMDMIVRLEASDNVSVTSVILRYQIDDEEWQEVEAERTAGDHLSGDYEAVIPGDEINGDSLVYQLVITDFSGNVTDSEVYTVDIQTGITIGYFEDFETEPTGWESFGRSDSWEWGEPTSGPEAASSGDNVYATNLDGDYDYMIDAKLVMPPITLPEGEAYLQFDQWHSFDTAIYPGDGEDYGHVIVSTDQDQEEWVQLETMEGNSTGWERVEIDLSDYSGQSIHVGFHVDSFSYFARDGWYLDDISLTDTSMNNQDQRRQLFEAAASSLDENTGEEDLLPLEAQISVLETGKSVISDPQTGEYFMNHEIGTYTLQADAYGYDAEQQEVVVESGNSIKADFTLQKTPEAQLSGTVINETTGEPIEGASVLLVEDANIAPVETNENGDFSLTAYEGNYTLRILAKDFHTKDMEIDLDGDIELNILLNPFYTIPGGEIGYDDGTAENARAFYDAGNGWAVKMSLPESEKAAKITDGVFQFYDADFPSPGGTEFAMEIREVGENGLPGERIFGPYDAEAVRDLDEWTVVDVSEHNIVVEDDFYMVYIQTADNPYAPGLATDENSGYSGRSYQYVEGEWEQTPFDQGNFMIRTRIAYEADHPVIHTPEDGYITNRKEIEIEGQATPETNFMLLNNGEEIGAGEMDEEGYFSLSASLSEGENKFEVISVLDENQSITSEAVTVTLDTEAPELTVENPLEGEKTNRETIIVEGHAADEHLESVNINGNSADINEGHFSNRVMLDGGENIIEVTAIDAAGNHMTENIVVQAKYTAPEIENLVPAEDQYVGAGDTLVIEFDSEPSLDATFSVLMPITNFGTQSVNPIELPLWETEEGHYTGYWTVPRNATGEGAVIQIKAEDSFGNVTYEKAEARLFINSD